MSKTRDLNIPQIPEIKNSEKIVLWLKFLQEISLFPPHNIDALIESIQDANKIGTPLPFICTLCPAIENLDTPTKEGQTRKLVPLSEDMPKLLMFAKEFFSFMLQTKDILSLEPEIFLIFGDILEPDSNKMFTNSDELDKIAKESIKTLQALFFKIDQENPGLFQSKKIKTPKIYLQSRIIQQAGNFGVDVARLIELIEFETLDPNSPAHEVFERHLRLTRNDPSFVPTGWQTRLGRETIHARIRFMIAQCWVDGVILPKVMGHLFKKSFGNGMPSPIFIMSTDRPAGAALQQECLNLGSLHQNILRINSNSHGVIAPFKNIGRWTFLE